MPELPAGSYRIYSAPYDKFILLITPYIDRVILSASYYYYGQVPRELQDIFGVSAPFILVGVTIYILSLWESARNIGEVPP